MGNGSEYIVERTKRTVITPCSLPQSGLRKNLLACFSGLLCKYAVRSICFKCSLSMRQWTISKQPPVGLEREKWPRCATAKCVLRDTWANSPDGLAVLPWINNQNLHSYLFVFQLVSMRGNLGSNFWKRLLTSDLLLGFTAEISRYSRRAVEPM